MNSLAASGEIDQQVRTLLSAGELLYEIDCELLANLRPDLIVTQAQCDVCAVPYSDVMQAVQGDPRLNHAQVIALNPSSLNDVLDDMLRIGAAAEIPDRAEQVVAGLRGRIEKVRCTTATMASADRPRTAIIEWTDPLMLAGNWVPEMIELAGGKCDLTPRGQHSRSFAWDELLRFDPQVIVVCPCGFDLDRAVAEADALAARPGWNRLTAVQTDRVFAVDGNACFNRPGPRLVDSLELLGGLLHPGRIAMPADSAEMYRPVRYATAPSVGPSPK